MSAGGSQAVQSVRASLSAAWFHKQAGKHSRQAGRHRAGCSGERAVCAALSTLAHDGVHHLDDRRVRADVASLANLDHLVIAPSGVYVVDAKNWAGRIEVRGSSVYQDDQCCDNRLLALTWLTHRVEDIMATSSPAWLRPQALVCFARSSPGLPPGLGPTLLTDTTRIGAVIAARRPVLSYAQMAELVELLSYAFPPYAVDPQELAEAEGLLFPELLTRHAGLTEALTKPVEDWMVWLHPEQASAVRRSFQGPARIRGAAGTGKTCVGLHRVAWLASVRPGRFLVTSFVKTLPVALASSYRRLSPSTAERVDFKHLHGVALELLRERDVAVRPDLGQAAFNAAWTLHGAGLTTGGLAKRYFEEEVEQVIKGRALDSLDAYLELDRVGRKTPLRPDVRRLVWALKEDYDRELAHRGQHDMVDVLRMARDEVRREPCPTWGGVMVDEVQDLPLVGLQFLHELAGRDRPDALLLIGDGQQAIYPGGFRLSEAGISVAGRAVVLRTNYRNTVEVLATARAVVQADGYEDLDVTAENGDRAVEVVRHGAMPLNLSYESPQQHDGALLWDLQGLADRGTRWSDIAVLCQTNAMAETYGRLLEEAGVPAVLLSSVKADGADAVKVGTWFRSKGMEFAHVFLPQVDRQTMLVTGAGAQARAEKEELHRRTLYVAMTRARDTLWIGRLGTPRTEPIGS